MSVVGALAANMGLEGPVSLQDVLSDPSVFLDSACWFKLLQDDSKEMTHKEIIQYLEPMKGKKPKKKYKNIAHGGYFYPKLYSLAGDVVALLETKKLEYFPRFPSSQKNMSNTIHIIGKLIANQKLSCAHVNVHSIGVDGGLMDLINSVEYAGRQQFYILSQQTKMLELLFEKYGVEGETKEATTDDKIQVAGIVFSELREYIHVGVFEGKQNQSRVGCSRIT
jgi:hypothetical protein